jgi:hypothetical protein
MINHVAKDIMRRFGVEKFIETGVFMGDSMMIVQDWFCEFFGSEFNVGPWTAKNNFVDNLQSMSRYQMHEVEINQKYVDEHIIPRWQNHGNVCIYRSDSVDWLKIAIDEKLFTSDDHCFFFLDAHQHDSTNPEPLRQEVEQVLRLKNQIICIDDWEVVGGSPGKHKDIYNTSIIKDLIKDRTNCVIASDLPNFHGKWCSFIFPDRQVAELLPKLQDLPLLVEEL